jgi:predicted nuclease of predicted toxin-antitoxin system
MARLYADEDFDYRVVEELRRLGHDVLTVQEDGHASADDSHVLAFATAHGRAILTHNRRDFIRLHRRTQPHSGIVICTRDNDFAALAARVHQAVSVSAPLDNQLIRVYRPATP